MRTIAYFPFMVLKGPMMSIATFCHSPSGGEVGPGVQPVCRDQATSSVDVVVVHQSHAEMSSVSMLKNICDSAHRKDAPCGI